MARCDADAFELPEECLVMAARLQEVLPQREPVSDWTGLPWGVFVFAAVVYILIWRMRL